MKNVTVNQCNRLENSLYAKSMSQNTEFVMKLECISNIWFCFVSFD